MLLLLLLFLLVSLNVTNGRVLELRNSMIEPSLIKRLTVQYRWAEADRTTANKSNIEERQPGGLLQKTCLFAPPPPPSSSASRWLSCRRLGDMTPSHLERLQMNRLINDRHRQPDWANDSESERLDLEAAAAARFVSIINGCFHHLTVEVPCERKASASAFSSTPARPLIDKSLDCAARVSDGCKLADHLKQLTTDASRPVLLLLLVLDVHLSYLPNVNINIPLVSQSAHTNERTNAVRE